MTLAEGVAGRAHGLSVVCGVPVCAQHVVPSAAPAWSRLLPSCWQPGLLRAWVRHLQLALPSWFPGTVWPPLSGAQ